MTIAKIQPSRGPNPQAQIDTAPAPSDGEKPARSLGTLCLVILWSAREPRRIGECARCEPGRTKVLGRAPQVQAHEQPLRFWPIRPGFSPSDTSPEPAAELLGEALSRRQMEVKNQGASLMVRNIGRCPMWCNGKLQSLAEIVPGDTIYFQQQLLLLCTSRSAAELGKMCYPPSRLGPFGYPDADGLVGESHAVHHLRQQLAWYGQTDGHVLIVGNSGAGKELAATALHNLSPRRTHPLLAENVATIPASLGSALLFGNRRNFPNPGMEERPGLVGLAEGGTLFLDEIGDMAAETQPLLLRVMERSGEYMRLGDQAPPRRANIRFIAATNHPERLRVELLRRFQHELHVPDLDKRREDIPLLLRHLLTLAAARRPALSTYLQDGQPNVDPRLIEQLVRRPYLTHVAELGFLLEEAMARSDGAQLSPLSDDILQRPRQAKSGSPADPPMGLAPPAPLPDEAEGSTRLPDAAEAQRALDEAQGSVVRAAQRLGINRHQLNRLIRRHQLSLNRPCPQSTKASS